MNDLISNEKCFDGLQKLSIMNVYEDDITQSQDAMKYEAFCGAVSKSHSTEELLFERRQETGKGNGSLQAAASTIMFC